MAANGIGLPSGFVIDEPQIEQQTPSGLPEGFVLDPSVNLPQGFQVDQPDEFKQEFPQSSDEMVNVVPDFGFRQDGSRKGPGFFGKLQLKGGGFATEYASEFTDDDGNRVDFPLISESLTPAELKLMSEDIIPNRKSIPESIIDKAIGDAKRRRGEGKSPFRSQSEIPQVEEGQLGTEFTPASGKITTVEDAELDKGLRDPGTIAQDVAGSFLTGAAAVPRGGAETIEGVGQLQRKAQSFIRDHPVASLAASMVFPLASPGIITAGVAGESTGKFMEFVGKSSSDFWAQEGDKRRDKFISEQGRESTHPAWIVTSSIAETTPQLISDYVLGQKLSKAAGGSASLVTSAIEGNTAGSSQKGQVEDAIDAMSDTELAGLPVFAESLEAANGDIKKAREIARQTASNRAYAQTFLTTTLTSLILDKAGAGTLDKWLVDPKVGKLGMKTILRMSGMEATEEAVQSGFETMIANRETGKPVFEGVLQAMGYGATTGAILGGALPGARGGLDRAQSAIEASRTPVEAVQEPGAVPPIQEIAPEGEAAVAPLEAPVEDVITPEPQRPELDALPDTGVVEAEGTVEEVFEPTKEEVDEQIKVTGSIEEKRAKFAQVSRNKAKAEKARAEQRREGGESIDERLEIFRDEIPSVRAPKKGAAIQTEVFGRRDKKGQFSERGIPTVKDALITWEEALERAKELGLIDKNAESPEALVPLYQGRLKDMPTFDEIESATERNDIMAYEGILYGEMVDDVQNGIRPQQDVIDEGPEVWDAVLRDTEADETKLVDSTDELTNFEEADVTLDDILAEREERISKEVKDAVREPSTEKVSVESEAKGGEEVRKTPEADKPSKAPVKEQVREPSEVGKPELEVTPPKSFAEGEQRLAERKITPKPKAAKETGLTQAEITKSREQAGQAELDKPGVESYESQLNQAKAEGLDRKATSIAHDVLDSDRKISRPEFAGMALRKGQVETELDEVWARVDKDTEAGRSPDIADLNQVDSLEGELDIITRAGNYANTESGRDLSIRKMFIDKDNFSVAALRRNAIKRKGDRLTDAEDTELRSVSQKIREAEAELAKVEKKAADAEAAFNEKIAGEAFVQEERKAKKTRRRKETLAKERVSLKNEIEALGYRVNDITGVPIEVARILSKMAVNHVEDGARSLSEVVERIQKDIPDIESTDIFNSFGGRLQSESKKAASEAQKAVKELKSQARKLGELEELLTKGKISKITKKRDVSAENQALQDALNDVRDVAYKTEMDDAKLRVVIERITKIKDQTEAGFRDIVEPVRPDSDKVKEAKRELKDVREIQKAVDVIASLKDDIRKGNLKDPTRKQSLAMSDELSKLKRRSELLKGAKRDAKRLQDLKGDIEALKQQLVTGERQKATARLEDSKAIKTVKREIRELRDIMRTDDSIKDLELQIETGDFKVTPQRAQRIISDNLERARVKLNKLKKEARNRVASMQPLTKEQMLVEITKNLPRTLLATADMSAVGRQGALLSARRPVAAAKAFGTSYKAFWSDHTAESVDLALKSGPMQKTRERAGLFLAGLNETANSSEEDFMSRVADRIPVVGKIVQASERHMVTHLNLLRASAFDAFAQSNPGATDVELKAWADYVNKASGRGDLGDFSSAARTLSGVLFAPRFTVSRFQTPATLVQNIRKNPKVAKEIGKDFAAMAGWAALILGLAKLAGAEVGDDPEDSDFGKIVIDNARIDIFAGFLQPIRLVLAGIYQSLGRAGVLKKVDPETGEIKERKAKADISEAFWRFAQYKFAPAVQLPLELIRGKNVVNQPTGAAEAVVRKMVPIVMQGAYDSIKSGKANQLLWATPLEFFGFGTNAYNDELQAADIKRVLKAADYSPSGPKYPDWVKQDGKVKEEYDIIFGQRLASEIRVLGLTEKDEIKDIAADIRKEMLSEIPEEK